MTSRMTDNMRIIVLLNSLCHLYFNNDNIVHLPLYDDYSDNEDSHAHDERQTNHNSDRQFCKHK